MRRHRRLKASNRANWFLVSILLWSVWVGSASLFGQNRESFDIEEFWKVLDALMPVEEHKGNITVRMTESLFTEYPETWFAISGLPRLFADAKLRVPVGQSLHDQLRNLRREALELGIDEVISKLEIHEWQFSLENCPSLEQRLTGFTTETRNWFSDLKLDYASLHISADIGLVHTGIILPADDFSHPVVEWANEALRDLESCAVRLTPEAAFRLRGILGVTESERDKIRTTIGPLVPEGGAFFLSENLRADLEGDEQADLVYIVQVFSDDDQDAEDWIASWIGMLAGSGVDPSPLRLSGPPTQVSEFASGQSRKLNLIGTEMERWPIDSPFIKTWQVSCRVELKDGKFVMTQPLERTDPSPPE